MERTQSFLLKYRRYAGAAARVPATVVGAASGQRVSKNQGKPQQARELLAPVYGWFAEGFDTLDLKEAKALLEELAS